MAKKQRQHIRKASNASANPAPPTNPQPQSQPTQQEIDSIIDRIDKMEKLAEDIHMKILSASNAKMKMSELEKSLLQRASSTASMDMGEVNDIAQHERETSTDRGISDWLQNEREGVLWILGCALIGAFLGFGIGCGWFTYGYGSYQRIIRESDAGGVLTSVREYVVSAWRVALARKIRRSFIYNLVMIKSTVNGDGRGFFSWVATSALWPPNWMPGSSIDLQKLSVGGNGLSPMTASFLSVVLPWRRPLINALSGNSMPGSPPSAMPSSKPSEPIDPYYHPMAFHALREHIIRHKRGYVHPDLGFLAPAPSGAARGIGMVRDTYNKCQIHCYPGTAEEVKEQGLELFKQKVALEKEQQVMKEMAEMYPDLTVKEVTADMVNLKSSLEGMYSPLKTTNLKEIEDSLQHQSTATTHHYSQEIVMLRIPIEAQITRKTAIDIIDPMLPEEFTAMSPPNQLDDAFLLALLLMHETGLGSRSQFWPYIATLPPHPSCAMHRAWRQSIVDVLTALALEMGTDVHGWPNEISKASDMMDKIAGSLIGFASFLEYNTSKFKNRHEALRWSLCQVASRAVAGKEKYGRLRLVPMMDMINHDEEADMFIELNGDESMQNGHFIGALEEDAGAFVVRSQRHGRRKVLKKGQVCTLKIVEPFIQSLVFIYILILNAGVDGKLQRAPLQPSRLVHQHGLCSTRASRKVDYARCWVAQRKEGKV